jgi:hypothetical protein
VDIPGQIIQQKKEELAFIKKELKDATYEPEVLDYEYAFLLLPIVWSITNEIEQLEQLRKIEEHHTDPAFYACLERLLQGSLLSPEIHINIGDAYGNYRTKAHCYPWPK